MIRSNLELDPPLNICVTRNLQRQKCHMYSNFHLTIHNADENYCLQLLLCIQLQIAVILDVAHWLPNSGSIKHRFRNVLVMELLALGISSIGKLIVLKYLHSLFMVELLVHEYKKAWIIFFGILHVYPFPICESELLYKNDYFYISLLAEHGQIYDQHKFKFCRFTQSKKFDYQNGCSIDLKVSKQWVNSIFQVSLSPAIRLRVI